MLEHWLWLAHRVGLNDAMKYTLLQHFEMPENVYSASQEAYMEVKGLTESQRQALSEKDLTLCRRALDQCGQKGIRVITIRDPAYPKRLQNIYAPPLVLYCKGSIPDFDDLPVIGIVGTRKPSAYGLTAAKRLGAEISSCGGLVVSGLASGVDAAAMSGALQAGGSAVGVLGCGVDVIYPRSNRELFARTEEAGCILSEFMPGTEPFKWNFPKRNRIISGLSCGVVVVEAPEKSGSLITARCALEQCRDVYAVPGNIDMPGFAGSNRLLRDGAGAVSCGWDVMSEYQSLFPGKIRKADARLPLSEETAAPEPASGSRKLAQKPRIPRKQSESAPSGKKEIDNRPDEPYIDIKPTLPSLTESEQAIVAALKAGERLVDDVIAETGLSSGKVLGALTMLELKRVIVRLPGKRICLKK